MKIGLMSDLHLEFALLEDSILQWRGDVLIIAGDLLEVSGISKFKDHLIRIFAMAPKVFVVFGNHEYYGGDLTTARSEFDKFLDENQLSHVRALENESVNLGPELWLFGSTMWTRYHNNPVFAQQCMQRMNDFRCIENSGKPVSPETFEFLHDKFCQQLRVFLHHMPKTARVIVATHHAPSQLSSNPKYRFEMALNSAYYEEMSEFLTNPKVKFWLHGHIHESQDYTIDGCRVLANPRGYIGYEHCASNFKVLEFEPN